jgi:hypothetical protein
MATTIRARIYARGEVSFAKFLFLPSFYFCQVGLQNCWRPIFLVLPKLYGCQVGLPNCWSCSYVCNKTNEEVVLLFFPNKPTHIPSQFTSLFKNIDRPRSLNLKLVNQINFPRD